MFFLGLFLTAFALCRPFEKNWNPTLDYGHCGSIVAEQEASAAVNLALDLIIVILPNAVLWKLRMPLRRKLGISVPLSLGIL